MPVIIPAALPATETLANEQIFVMHEQRALSQDIRPLRLAIVNLRPTKIVTETQLLRLISNTALQVEVDLIRMASHTSKNVSEEHLQAFYKDFEEIKYNRYDGMIITGAPVEHMSFQEVNYWDELRMIFDFADKNVFSSLFICWGAQAALYHYYGVPKYQLPQNGLVFLSMKCCANGLLCAALMMCFMRPILGIPSFGQGTLPRWRNWKSLRSHRKPAFIWWPVRMGIGYLFPVIASMTH